MCAISPGIWARWHSWARCCLGFARCVFGNGWRDLDWKYRQTLRLPGFAPEDVDLVDGAAFEGGPFGGALVEGFVFAEAWIAFDGELIIFQSFLRVAGSPIAEDE